MRGPRLVFATLAIASMLGAPSATAATGTGSYVREIVKPVRKARVFVLPRHASNVAVHWPGHRHARVLISFRREGRRFGRPMRVALDEVGLERRTRETYGTVLPAPRVRAVRVSTDRPLRRLAVVAFSESRPKARLRATTPASGLEPPVISRAGWGADESLRFDSSGKETWPPAFWPIQKLIVHHTATRNNDPDPSATVRSIYYYHAVTQGWGDIGYNFLIDEAGNVYEGRHSRDYAPGETPTGRNLAGDGVTGAHAQGFNSGTVGIALLGTLTSQDATAAARDTLERLLAWEAYESGIDPLGSSLYTNPVSGQTATFANIAGHRDVGSTECPGATFYTTLPAIRSDVDARVAAASAYARPKGATPLRLPLVPAFAPCTASNTTHGDPLSFPSCGPPHQESRYLTVGTPDANGLAAASTGWVGLRAQPGNPATIQDEADATITALVSDVRERSSLRYYAGELLAKATLRITDHGSGSSGTDPATMVDTPLQITIPCGASSSGSGVCSIATSADALSPGTVVEGRRSIWQVENLDLLDGGADGVAATAGNDVFMRPGLFVP
jgi:N-acetylmuramoyl-L-alanine amidase